MATARERGLTMKASRLPSLAAADVSVAEADLEDRTSAPNRAALGRRGAR